MDIAGKLLRENSRRTAEAIVEYIGGDPDRFSQLVSTFFRGEYRLTQRAAWPISIVAERQPELLQPYLSRFVTQLPKKDIHPAVKRNIVRLLQYVELPKRLRGRVFCHCIDLIDDQGEPVAVRCFAMTVAARVAASEPALKQELRLVVEKQKEHATAGLKVRIRRILSGK